MTTKTLRSRYEIEFREVDLEQAEERLTELLNETSRELMLDRCRQLQLTVYVMCGGGFLGRNAAEQPEDFYIDDRASTAYHPKAIYQSVKVLCIYAKILGLDPRNLDPTSELFPDKGWNFMQHHNCGVF